MVKKIFKGDRIHKITTTKKFKKVMIELLKGYPEYEYFGIFESYFTDTGEKVVQILDKDGLIEISQKKEEMPAMYRLTPLGINLAISMINLDYSEKVLKYSQETHRFTKLLGWFTGILIWLTVNMLIIGYCQLFNLFGL